jgi:transcriptional regulator with XRE-family HTH domain
MINEALRLLRIYHDMSQSELCSELRLSNSYVSELESGKKQPSLEILERYADFFQLPLSSLLLFSEQLGKLGHGDGVRQMVAKKALALLKWVEEKNVRPQIKKTA